MVRYRFRILLYLLLVPLLAHAGGPSYVAGNSFFDPDVKGTPLTWAQGSINYYTDQSDLSPLLPGAAADAFVADAFTRWTSISTAAVSATRAGQLDEDVSGANVFLNSDGTISSPPDILPTSAKPLAVVYDASGQVTDALLGQGAGDSSLCFTNAVFGGPDNFSSDGHLTHALVVLNGNCASVSSQLPDVKYRLVRVLGRVLGLGWSQTNLNPSPQDYGGFTIMHAQDSLSCSPITLCYTSPDIPKMDDRAALSQLYPVTSQNLAAFPGKQIFQANTVRFRGSVRFTDENGQPAQPMQGVNVVARWIDPSTGGASPTFVASSVSGFLFRGNAGNPVTGFIDSLGQPLDRFGSDDPSLEGFFDLAGLEIPDGSPSAQYQITIEPVDPLLSQAVGPYAPWQVQPSGTPRPLTVTITRGGDVQQDILMRRGALDTPDWFGAQSFENPVLVPKGSDWAGSLSGYGDADYFRLAGQANRTLSVEATALDESGAPSFNKARPVIGIWSLANPDTPAPVATPDAFNTSTVGMSRLDVSLLSSTDFRIGIADSRGDGRPDFRYRARVFYGDSITPTRASTQGGTTLAVRGLGFHSNTKAVAAGHNAQVLATAANQVLMTVPPAKDGFADISLSDPLTGSSSTMTGVVTYGAGPNDAIKLLAGTNPSTPRGGEAPNPIRLQVLNLNGVTPVSGASVFLTASPAVSFAACNGAGSCTVVSDESGEVSTRVTVLSASTMTITAQLAPASYSPPKQVQATLLGTNASLDLSLTSPDVPIAQGATLDLPLSAKVLASGAGSAGRTVNYKITSGTATLSAAAAVTNQSGVAISILHLTTISSEVDISACVGTQNSPCRIFHVFPVSLSGLRLKPVTGSFQVAATGQIFQPVAARVFDSATGNPVQGANVVFQTIVGRTASNDPVISIGDTNIKRNPIPVILASSQTTIVSDGDGLATIRPTSAGIPGAVVVQATATVGTASLPFLAQSVGP